MKNWICFFLLLGGLFQQSSAQVKKTSSAAIKGHAIQITLKPYQKSKIYIGTNYGNNRVLADSCYFKRKK